MAVSLPQSAPARHLEQARGVSGSGCVDVVRQPVRWRRRAARIGIPGQRRSILKPRAAPRRVFRRVSIPRRAVRRIISAKGCGRS